MSECVACEGTNTAFLVVVGGFACLAFIYCCGFCRKHASLMDKPIAQVVPEEGDVQTASFKANIQHRLGSIGHVDPTAPHGTIMQQMIGGAVDTAANMTGKAIHMSEKAIHLADKALENSPRMAKLRQPTSKKLMIKRQNTDQNIIKMSGDINSDLKVELYNSKLHKVLGVATLTNEDLLHSTGVSKDLKLVSEGLKEGVYGDINLDLTAKRSLTTKILHATGLDKSLYTNKVEGTYVAVSFKKDLRTAPVQIHRTHSRMSASPVWEETCPTQKLPYATEMSHSSVTVTVWLAMADGYDVCAGEVVVDAFEIMESVRKREPIVVKLAQNKKHQTLSSLVQGTVAVSFTLNTNMEVKVNEVRRDARVPVDKTANTPYAILYLGDTRVATTANAEQSETDQSLTQWKDNKYQIRLTGNMAERTLLVLHAVAKLKRRKASVAAVRQRAAKSESRESEPPQGEPAQSELAKSELTKSEPTSSEPAKSDPAKSAAVSGQGEQTGVLGLQMPTSPPRGGKLPPLKPLGGAAPP